MRSSPCLDDLIPAVYEAAVEPEGWPAALAATARRTEAAFHTHDLALGAVAAAFQEGMIDASLYGRALIARPVAAIADPRSCG